jgi:hypothetical protein
MRVQWRRLGKNQHKRGCSYPCVLVIPSPSMREVPLAADKNGNLGCLVLRILQGFTRRVPRASEVPLAADENGNLGCLVVSDIARLYTASPKSE